jgi:hypothetical protein
VIHYSSTVVVTRRDLNEVPRPVAADHFHRTIGRSGINHDELPTPLFLRLEGGQGVPQRPVKDRIMMLAKGSLMVLANRSRVYAGGSLKDIGCFPTLFQVFTYFRLAASRRYAHH